MVLPYAASLWYPTDDLDMNLRYLTLMNEMCLCESSVSISLQEFCLMMITHLIPFLINIIILYNTATLLDDKIFETCSIMFYDACSHMS